MHETGKCNYHNQEQSTLPKQQQWPATLKWIEQVLKLNILLFQPKIFEFKQLQFTEIPKSPTVRIKVTRKQNQCQTQLFS